MKVKENPFQAPPQLGDQVQFSFQPSESTESTSATPTANIFAQAFKNPPKLKHVTPPTVKNAAIDQPKNSVQAEKERIFEEQARIRVLRETFWFISRLYAADRYIDHYALAG